MFYILVCLILKLHFEAGSYITAHIYEEKQGSKKQWLVHGQLEKLRSGLGPLWSQHLGSQTHRLHCPVVHLNKSTQVGHLGDVIQGKLMFVFSHATIIPNTTAKLQHTTVLVQKTKMPSEPTRAWNSFNWDKSPFEHGHNQEKPILTKFFGGKSS